LISAYASEKLLKIRQYSWRNFARLGKNPLRENCLHLSARNIRRIFPAADAALLMQSQDNKVKSTEGGRRQAMWVRLTSP